MFSVFPRSIFQDRKSAEAKTQHRLKEFSDVDVDRYHLRLHGEGRFVESAKELTRLRDGLQQLAKQLE